MSDDIPYAQPFQWNEESQGNSTRSLRKRKFVGSGLALLRKESLGSESKMGNVTKNILMNLFHQHGIELDGEMESDEHKFKGIGLAGKTLLGKQEAEGESGNKSLFVALLKVISDSSNSITPTRQFLSKVSPTLIPGSLPGTLDSKDMVLAALHFLSSNSDAKSDHVLRLPLIKPVQAYGDLEKRNYKKVGDWKLDDIMVQLARMEEIFLSSPSSWQWQKRESLSLRLSRDDEEFFFTKGTVPLSATAKKLKAETVKKRKAPVKAAKATGSPNAEVDASGKQVKLED